MATASVRSLVSYHHRPERKDRWHPHPTKSPDDKRSGAPRDGTRRSNMEITQTAEATGVVER